MFLYQFDLDVTNYEDAKLLLTTLTTLKNKLVMNEAHFTIKRRPDVAFSQALKWAWNSYREIKEAYLAIITPVEKARSNPNWFKKYDFRNGASVVASNKGFSVHVKQDDEIINVGILFDSFHKAKACALDPFDEILWTNDQVIIKTYSFKFTEKYIQVLNDGTFNVIYQNNVIATTKSYDEAYAIV